MDFGGSCANDCLDFGLLGALQGVLLVGSHDLTVDAGIHIYMCVKDLTTCQRTIHRSSIFPLLSCFICCIFVCYILILGDVLCAALLSDGVQLTEHLSNQVECCKRFSFFLFCIIGLA